MTRPPLLRGRRAGRLPAALAAVAAVALLVPATALAATARAHGGGSVVPFAFLGIPSISSILGSIANDLFKVLAGAFLPSWLRNAPAEVLRWLIALPNPANAVQWPTMHHLEQDTTSVAVAFLPLTFAIAAARYMASGVTGGAHHPAESLGRLVGAALGLLIFPWAFSNVVAAVNVTTGALLGFADVDHGLQRALVLMFTGGLMFGVTGPLIALFVIAAILLAAGLFIMKVAILALFALLFVAGPLTLAGYPIPELHGAFRLWAGLLLAVAMIPIGWCVIFATAGAISADITHISTPAAIGTRIVGFFAGMLMFFIAFRWPFFLITMVKNRGLLSTDLGSGGARPGAAAGGTSIASRMGQGKLALLSAAGVAGQAVSHAGRAAGMPGGGLAGLAGRAGVGLAGRAAGTQTGIQARGGTAVAWENLRERAGGSRIGRSGVGQRVAAAATVAKTAPAAVSAAVRAGGSPAEGHAAAAGVLASAVAGGATRAGRAGRATRDGSSGRPAAPPAAETALQGGPTTPANGGAAGNGGLSSAAARASVDTAAAASAAAAHQAAAANTPPPRAAPTTRPASPRTSATTPTTPPASPRTAPTPKPSTRKPRPTTPTRTPPAQNGTGPRLDGTGRDPGPGSKGMS